MLPDHGVEVFGIHAQEGRVGTLFFGLGEGPDADTARAKLKRQCAANGEGPPPAPQAPSKAASREYRHSRRQA